MLIVIEGIDGAGKTTQVQMLKQALERAGDQPVVSKEPTDGPWGRRIRASATEGRLSLAEELDAFLHDRTEHVETLIQPALDAGRTVILDRYFYSTIAYQGARGADPGELQKLMESRFPIPDAVFILDVPPELGLHRVARLRGDQPNQFENLENLSRARAIFNRIDGSTVHRIDASALPNAIHAQILEKLRPLSRKLEAGVAPPA